jgi:hypothetical protein
MYHHDVSYISFANIHPLLIFAVINRALDHRVSGVFMRIIIALGATLLLQGCVASIVKDVVTAPIKIVSKTADVMTTSQSESDEKRGKEMRKKEERLGKLARDKDKFVKKCNDGNADACEQAEAIDAAIAQEQDRVL